MVEENNEDNEIISKIDAFLDKKGYEIFYKLQLINELLQVYISDIKEIVYSDDEDEDDDSNDDDLDEEFEESEPQPIKKEQIIEKTVEEAEEIAEPKYKGIASDKIRLNSPKLKIIQPIKIKENIREKEVEDDI